VTIVCVYNDPDVLRTCLEASVTSGLADAPQTQFVPIDNRGNPFSTAGAALNHGARQAVNDVVVFVHQDVVLHSLVALEEAAHVLLIHPEIGIMGAVGIDDHRRIVGRIRDRVVAIGEPAPRPRDIDSLDEVLFMITRAQVLREPLTEDPILAWHAYGVEYSCRVRRAGQRAVAFDVPITHNSLTVNLARLDEAHRRVGDTYPELLPIHTTCGTVHRGDGPGGLSRTLRRARGAAIWWGESLEARHLGRHAPSSPVVLSDIRLVIDEAVTAGGKQSLRVLDVEADAPGRSPVDGVERFGIPFGVQSVHPEDVPTLLAERADDELILVSGIERHRLGELGLTAELPHVVGYWKDTGIWALVGVDAATLAPLWAQPRNRPFAGVLQRDRTLATQG
jgi:hypothetical protein